MWLLFMACKSPADEAQDDSSTTEVTVGAFEITTTLSEVIPTVSTVSWTLDEVTEANIEFGIDDFGMSAPVDLDGGAPYATSILGMKPGTTYKVRVIAQTPSGEVQSDTQTVSTGFAPNTLPTVTLTETSAEASGGFFVTSIVTNPAAAVILDQDGDYVWWYLPEDTQMLARTIVSGDGQSIVLGEINNEGEQEATFKRVSLDGTTVEATPVDYRHHDLVELGDGTLGMLRYDPRTIEGDFVPGDAIVEVDDAGTETMVWSIWDKRTYDPDGGGGGSAAGWPHANALDYVAEDDAYIVSVLDLGALIKVDRKTGQELWVLGGEESDFSTKTGSQTYFDVAHQMHSLGDRLLLFNNGRSQKGGSQAIELTLDLPGGSAEEAWQYSPNPPLTNPVLGDVSRLDNGHTLVTFSFNGQIDEVDENGELVWRVNTSVGGAFGYLTWHEDLNRR